MHFFKTLNIRCHISNIIKIRCTVFINKRLCIDCVSIPDDNGVENNVPPVIKSQFYSDQFSFHHELRSHNFDLSKSTSSISMMVLNSCNTFMRLSRLQKTSEEMNLFCFSSFYLIFLNAVMMLFTVDIRSTLGNENPTGYITPIP